MIVSLKIVDHLRKVARDDNHVAKDMVREFLGVTQVSQSDIDALDDDVTPNSKFLD